MCATILVNELPRLETLHKASPRGVSSSSDARNREFWSRGDMEDMPVNIKKFAKASQNCVRASFPEPESAYEHRQIWKLLYKVHVQVITHGAILCGENPLCCECPLLDRCDYGKQHYKPELTAKSSQLSSKDGRFKVTTARVLRDNCYSGKGRKTGDAIPLLFLPEKHYSTGEVEGRLLVSAWSAFDGVFPMNGTYFFQNEVFEDEATG